MKLLLLQVSEVLDLREMPSRVTLRDRSYVKGSRPNLDWTRFRGRNKCCPAKYLNQKTQLFVEAS
jgi:hypothetical protein